MLELSTLVLSLLFWTKCGTPGMIHREPPKERLVGSFHMLIKHFTRFPDARRLRVYSSCWWRFEKQETFSPSYDSVIIKADRVQVVRHRWSMWLLESLGVMSWRGGPGIQSVQYGAMRPCDSWGDWGKTMQATRRQPTVMQFSVLYEWRAYSRGGCP